MSTSNPFEKLQVKHDKEDDDEQGEFEQVKAKDKNVPFGIEQKKKKVRPKEKVEEEQNEGFEEVKKTYKKRPQNEEEEEGKGKEHTKRKGINYHTNEERQYRENKKSTRGRKFDRQSGTGRGKEIAKDGAGGKFTWEGDYENTNDDYYFEEALNPENKEKRRPPRKPRREEDNKEEGEDNKKNEGETKEEGKQFEKEEKRERKKPELKEEEKLKIPEKAISLQDYYKTTKKPQEEEKKEVKRIQDGKPLTKVEEKKIDIFGTSGPGKKKGKKKKEKELNQQEIDLNAQIGAEIQIGEGVEGRPRRGRERGGKGQGGRGRVRGGRGGRGRGKEEDKEDKFVFNEEDFPKLE